MVHWQTLPIHTLTHHTIALRWLSLCLWSNVWIHGDAGRLKGIYAWDQMIEKKKPSAASAVWSWCIYEPCILIGVNLCNDSKLITYWQNNVLTFSFTHLSGVLLFPFSLTSSRSSEESTGEVVLVSRSSCSCWARYWAGFCLASLAQCSSSLWRSGRLAYKRKQRCITRGNWTTIQYFLYNTDKDINIFLFALQQKYKNTHTVREGNHDNNNLHTKISLNGYIL